MTLSPTQNSFDCQANETEIKAFVAAGSYTHKKMVPKIILDELLTCQLETIQSSSFLEPLTTSQIKMFNDVVTILRTQLDNGSPNQVNLVFRGDRLDYLASRLTTKRKRLKKIDKISAYLFYFGDKARHYYKHDDAAAKNLRWLTQIEDASEKTCSAIFENIKRVLDQPGFLEFRRSNKSFANYFSADNLLMFTSQIAGDQTARDYYLYFLHTAGRTGIWDSSVLVSTSLSYDKAWEFSGGLPGGCIIYYVVPEPLQRFAVSHLRMKSYESKLLENGLPTYKNKTLYAEECEIAIRGALFSCFIFGLKVLNGNRFIVNPHLFSEVNIAADSILKGLIIDQSDFAERLNDTGYFRGVCTRFDGSYKTLSRTP